MLNFTSYLTAPGLTLGYLRGKRFTLVLNVVDPQKVLLWNLSLLL